ncbi:MAG: glucose-6-phosphate isomerase [Xanthobacteraceae bacterium]|nr:glucose-6-phosphate isomerase [Xanthobacteraceae bacterium]
MHFEQSIDLALSDHIGSGGVTRENYAGALVQTAEALDWLNARHADGGLPLLRLPGTTDDLDAVQEIARRLKDGATDVVILGTGGSSLGGQALLQLAGHAVPGAGQPSGRPRMHFMDNLDPQSFAELLARLPLATSRFVAISKSGGTGETLMQTASVIAALQKAGLTARIPELMLGLSEPARAGKPNGLRSLLAPFNVPFIEHDTGVGGRFSVLTNVGLLPAAIAGLDIAKIRAGALTALQPILDGQAPDQVPAAVGAALSIALAETSGKSITVLMAYADRLGLFSRWYVQLWAESLGKAGKGTTPIAAIGPVDQHSQLQLFIAGPPDKMFTVITLDVAGTGPKISADLAQLAGEPDFAGRTIGDLVAAQGRATAETLAKNGRPVRAIHIERLDEAALGALLMHFMLETIIAARLLGVDAFDQPAVEEGKVLAKRYLAEKS